MGVDTIPHASWSVKTLVGWSPRQNHIQLPERELGRYYVAQMNDLIVHSSQGASEPVRAGKPRMAEAGPEAER
jgi:hypothetical protein